MILRQSVWNKLGEPIFPLLATASKMWPEAGQQGTVQKCYQLWECQVDRSVYACM